MGLSPLYPTLTSDLHVSTAQGPPSKFPPTSTSSGIIHNLSGPRICTITRSKTTMLIIQSWYKVGTQWTVLHFHFAHMTFSHFGLHISQTPRSVFQDGSVFVTLQNQNNANKSWMIKTKTSFLEFHPFISVIVGAIKFLVISMKPPFCFYSRVLNHCWKTLEISWQIMIVLLQLQVLFTLLSKSFSPFPHGTCSLLVSRFVFSLGRILSPAFILHYQAVLLFDIDYYSAIRETTGLSPSLVYCVTMLF